MQIGRNGLEKTIKRRKRRIAGMEQLRSSIIQPMQFLRVPHTLLYCGKLREYVSNTCSEGICEDATNRTVHRRLP